MRTGGAVFAAGASVGASCVLVSTGAVGFGFAFALGGLPIRVAMAVSTNAPRLALSPALVGLVPSTGLSNPATSVGAVSLAPSGVSLPATTAGLS